MQNLILNKTQAEMTRDAVCAINNVGGRLSFCFSLQFSDYEILNDRDVITKLINAYGVS